MNKLFGYARVSTTGQNLDTQLDALNRAGCDEIFQDKITGVSISRPALDAMLAKLRPGDTVMVARFFRLGRSRDHLINLLGDFSQKGIHFKALDLGVDSSTPAGKLVLQIFSALAEYDGTGHPAGKYTRKNAGWANTSEISGQTHWSPIGSGSGRNGQSQKSNEAGHVSGGNGKPYPY